MNLISIIQSYVRKQACFSLLYLLHARHIRVAYKLYKYIIRIKHLNCYWGRTPCLSLFLFTHPLTIYLCSSIRDELCKHILEKEWYSTSIKTFLFVLTMWTIDFFINRTNRKMKFYLYRSVSSLLHNNNDEW